MDHAHVRGLLERFPRVPFVFVGKLALKEDDPDRSIYLPGRYPNVHFVGVKPFKELKGYIAGSRFCLAPMDLRFPGNDISHHKTFQYLALGKPVFSTVFSEYLPIRDLMYMENDRSRSIGLLAEFLEKGEPEHLAEQRIAYARSMTYERTFERIERFLENAPNTNLTPPATTARSIFLFSNEPWGDMWYSKHHYAAELAKHHEVYFVNMPRRWGLSSLFSWRARTRLTPEGVHVVDYTNTLPRRLGAFVGRWSGRKVMRLRPHARAVCWSFNPLALQECLAMRAGGAKLIYHTVDPYQAFPEDAVMARSADLMVCVNKWFFDYYERYNPHRVLIPHGVRWEDREFDTGAVERLRSEHGRFALLAASLTEYANFPLLTAVARRFPGTRILVVGSKFPLSADAGSERDEFLALPNVIYLGVLHPDDLRNLARAATVGLLAYDFEVRRSVPISGGRTPLKVLTYLAQHCPLVTTNNSYIPELEEKGCFKADTVEGFLRIMADVLEGRLVVDKEAVDRYLNEVTYEKLVERVFRALDGPRS